MTTSIADKERGLGRFMGHKHTTLRNQQKKLNKTMNLVDDLRVWRIEVFPLPDSVSFSHNIASLDLGGVILTIPRLCPD